MFSNHELVLSRRTNHVLEEIFFTYRLWTRLLLDLLLTAVERADSEC